MDKNNQDSQNSSRGLNIPDRSGINSRAQAQQQAAANFARGQVERIYDGGSSHNTPHTTPINITPAQTPQTSPVSPVQKQTEQQPANQPQILNKTQKVIQPVPTNQKTTANQKPLGAVEYKPDPKRRQESANRQTADYGDQWKRYHAAWQNYYQKYYESYYTAAVRSNISKSKSASQEQPPLSEDDKKAQALHSLRTKISNQARENTKKFRKSRHFVPIISAILVVSVFLFLQYNRFLVAGVYAYVAPGNASPQELIYSPSASVTVGPEPKLIIPKINVDVPVVYGVGNDQKSQLDAMNQGVAHFSIPGASSVPGQVGNTVLSGHSSNDLFDSGNYKFIFAQLDRLEEDDIIYANYDSVRYSYKITEKKVVMPTDVQALIYPTEKPILTLITCTPLGTAEKRLLVIAEQISPDPNNAKPQEQSSAQTEEVEMPRSAPTFFERLFSWDWE
ncbi:MAG: sortase [Candidatus Sacchiramonaceae bacterium]|nr:sortase [Candidatus Saccharimonadaceae bacterium]